MNIIFIQAKTGCPYNREIGGKMICLPKVPELIEVGYNDEMRELLALSETDILIGYYMTDNYISSIINESECFMDCDQIKVYSTELVENFKITSYSVLDELWKEIAKLFYSDDFLDDTFKKNIEKSKKMQDLNLSVEKPFVIEEFELNSKVKSLLMLMKVNYGGIDLENPYMIVAYNMTIINQRIVYYSYTLPYQGRESIEYIKTKSNAFGRKLLSVNNIY